MHRHGAGEEAVYARLPADVGRRRVLLLDPVVGTGHTACRAIQVRGRSASAACARAALCACVCFLCGCDHLRARCVLPGYKQEATHHHIQTTPKRAQNTATTHNNHDATQSA